MHADAVPLNVMFAAGIHESEQCLIVSLFLCSCRLCIFGFSAFVDVNKSLQYLCHLDEFVF